MNTVQYFKTKSGFDRFFQKAKEKYFVYGKVTGTIKLDCISKEEAFSFTDYFGTKFVEKNNVTISIKQFLKVLEHTKYADFDFEQFLQEYFNEIPLKTKAKLNAEKETQFLTFFETLFSKFRSQDLRTYLQISLVSNNSMGQILKRQYRENQKILERNLLAIDLLLCSLPSEVTYLPIYASITSNPHFLDFNQSTSSLFFRVLSGIFHLEMPSTNEEKINLLQKINVYTDPVSNYVITYQLRSTDLYNEFSTTFGPLNLNIDNILQLKDVSGIKNKIFIFENPSILNYLKEISLDASVVITSGVPNLAFYKLLEVVSENNILYYNGDFDPEGLLIADKLKQKYPNLVLFGYSEENYLKCKPKEIISDKSLHKLDLVKSDELLAVKKCVLEKKKAGYQENNLETIRQFLLDTL